MSPSQDLNSLRLNVRVAPGGSRSAVVGRHGDAWKLRVVAAPERGRANDAVVALLAATLDVKRLNVTIVSGISSRNKTVEIVGLTLDEAESRLTNAQEGAS